MMESRDDAQRGGLLACCIYAVLHNKCWVHTYVHIHSMLWQAQVSTARPDSCLAFPAGGTIQNKIDVTAWPACVTPQRNPACCAVGRAAVILDSGPQVEINTGSYICDSTSSSMETPLSFYTCHSNRDQGPACRVVYLQALASQLSYVLEIRDA